MFYEARRSNGPLNRQPRRRDGTLNRHHLRDRQEAFVLDHLTNVGTISGREAEDIYRIRDLPKRISVLRQEGHSIKVVLKTDTLGQRYARYAFTANKELLNA
jgi:hypothetical protein